MLSLLPNVGHDRIEVPAEPYERPMSTVPAGQQTIDGLLDRATECEAMAARATTTAAASALRRQAARFREMARQLVTTLAFPPGEPAPLAGRYQQLNIFGSRTATTVHVQRGEPLPAAPRSFTWRLLEES
jgi:hypothetical protein